MYTFNKFSAKTSVIVAGGYDGNQWLDVVEVLNGDQQICLLPSLPAKIGGRPSVFQHGEDILVCGGYDNENSCLKLDNGEWSTFNSLRIGRYVSSAVSEVK